MDNSYGVDALTPIKYETIEAVKKKKCPTSQTSEGNADAAANRAVTLRSLARSAKRLEGWKPAPSLLPPFETAARKRARPPQGDGGDCCGHIRMALLVDWDGY
jgi:hypothetical protein